MFKGYKTYIMAGVAVLTAVSAYLVGDADVTATITAVATALSIAFLRNGVASAGA